MKWGHFFTQDIYIERGGIEDGERVKWQLFGIPDEGNYRETVNKKMALLEGSTSLLTSAVF